MSKLNPEKIAAITIHDDTRIHGFFGEYRWLSNFHLSPIKGTRFTYPSVENAYQAAKWPTTEREQFVSITPAQSKSLGREGKLYTPKEWDNVKFMIMAWALGVKFTDPELASKLLATGDRHLEETNWWKDTYWGVCNGKGENYLGILLMKIRAKLRSNIENKSTIL